MAAAQAVADTSVIDPSEVCWAVRVVLVETARMADQAVARIPAVEPRTFVAGFR